MRWNEFEMIGVIELIVSDLRQILNLNMSNNVVAKDMNLNSKVSEVIHDA